VEAKEDAMMLSALVLAALLGEQGPEPAVAVPEATASARPHIAAGIALYMKRRFRAAADEFRAAADADPASAAAQYYLGYTLYKIGEPTRRLTPEKQESRDHFAKAFELDPSFRPTWTAP
jgi:tetratricopeptide (TPR) repeat protein